VSIHWPGIHEVLRGAKRSAPKRRWFPHRVNPDVQLKEASNNGRKVDDPCPGPVGERDRTDASFNPIVNNDGPVAFQYFGVNSNNGTLSFFGQNGIVGCIYAPYAKIAIAGGGHINGSIVARTVKMNGNAALHYDESL
jgi:hypothetical protein